MRINSLLNYIEHRPWELPKENWTFYQEWNNAIFLHWQVNYEELRSFVPNEIEIDLFQNKAWISLVAFTMEKARIRKLPSLELISNFHEINIRTYVKHNNKQGVYFLSIEAARKISCRLANIISELPYRFSKMSRKEHCFHSKNIDFNDHFSLEYKTGETIGKKEPVDLWLTERYALFQNTDTRINEFEIHHIEWPLKKIELINLDLNYNRFKKLIHNQPERMTYSNGVQVIGWKKRKIVSKYSHKGIE